MAKELTESRRTRYTRRAMQDALIDLMRERPLGSITIKALCEQADVNRSTFYAHYDSIEELLHDIEDETMAWVTTALDQLLMQPDAAGVEHVIEHICRYIADNRNHLQVLMSPTADLDFQQQLLGLIYSRRSVAEQMQPASSDPAEAQMRMRFAVSGSIGLLQYWLSPPHQKPSPTSSSPWACLAPGETDDSGLGPPGIIWPECRSGTRRIGDAGHKESTGHDIFFAPAQIVCIIAI